MDTFKERYLNGILEGYISEDGNYSFGTRSEDGVALKARIDASDSDLTIIAWVEPVKGWVERRRANVADGGYGTQIEQLEILGEQGIDAYQQHIAAVKAAHPKP